MCSGCPATPALAPTLSLTGLGSTHTGETSPCGIGRCPTCSGFMQKAAGGGGGLTVAAGIDECGVCHQARPVAERLRGTPVCGACSLGVRHPLRYECERCLRVQLNPYPYPYPYPYSYPYPWP